MASDIAMNDRAVERHDAQITGADEDGLCRVCGGSGECNECAGFGYLVTFVGRGTCDGPKGCGGTGYCHACKGEGVPA